MATVDQPTNAPKMSTSAIADLLTKVYGPYAFGIVSMLILWMVVVRPELNNQRINFDAQAVILGQMRDIQEQQRIVSMNLQQTALVLDRVVEKMDSK